MKKTILSLLFILATYVSALAVPPPAFQSGCFEVYPDGSAYFKVNYTGHPTFPADQELRVYYGGTYIGPFVPDYATGVGTGDWIDYYFLPAGTFKYPASDCFKILDAGFHEHEICRCETVDCNADFQFIQYSFNNAASIVPSSSCTDCIYGYDYGTGDPVEYGTTYSRLYSASGTYKVCLTVITPEGNICKKCKDFCINVSEEEDGDVEYPHPDGLWKGNQVEGRQYKDAGKVFHVSPNPAKESINIKGQLDRQSAVTVRVINALGQEVLKQDFKGEPGSFKQAFSLDQFSSGIYTVMIIANGLEETHRLSISK